jgi:hypothetical protein
MEYIVSLTCNGVSRIVTLAAIAFAASAHAPQAGAQSKPVKQKVDACQYLAITDVAKAIGKPILNTMELPMGSDMGACSYYTDVAKTQPMLSTHLHTAKGSFHYSLYCETNKGDVKPGEPVAGVGDQACLRDKSALIVRKGDKLIMITAATMGSPRDQLVNLAKIALTKM